MMRMIRMLLWIAVLLPGAAAAQPVLVRGSGDPDNDAFLREVARRDGLTVITRDTVVGQGSTIAGDVLVAGATLRLDGTVTGDVIIVDGTFFLRPTARVQGSIRNVGGGFYPSELATVDGGMHNEPNAPYLARIRDDGAVILIGTTRSSAVELLGFSGFHPPTYDRVDGLRLSAGAALHLPRLGSIEPIVRGRADYAFARSEFGGLAELALARRRTELAAGFERATLTNERWIKSDITNTVSSIVQGKDRRNYYDADRYYVEARRVLQQTPGRTSSLFLRGQREDARSLRSDDPWSLTGDLDRFNPPVHEGRINSLLAGAAMEWTRQTYAIEAAGHLEFAEFDGRRRFDAWLADVEWAMPAIANHTLELDLHFQGPLPGTEVLPRQRWSFVGGSGTLQTFELAQFPGDRIAMVETSYGIPLPWFELPALGLPTLDLLHAIGMGWSRGIDRSFEQNVGLRVRYNVVYARFLVDPSDTGEQKLSFGVSVPRKLYPWQRRAEER